MGSKRKNNKGKACDGRKRKTNDGRKPNADDRPDRKPKDDSGKARPKKRRTPAPKMPPVPDETVPARPRPEKTGTGSRLSWSYDMNKAAEINTDAVGEAVKKCDLATIRDLAGITPQQSKAERLASLQELLGGFPPGDILEQLFLFVDILANCDDLTKWDSLQATLREAQERLAADLGPYAKDFISVEDVFLGCLRNRAVFTGSNDSVAHTLRSLLAGGRSDGSFAIPPALFLYGFCRKVTDMLVPIDDDNHTLAIDDTHVGSPQPYGRLGNCERCDGEGGPPCPTCRGQGRVISNIVGNAAGTHELDPVLRMLLGNLRNIEFKVCDDCGGIGSTNPCHCRVLVDTPVGAQVGWIVKFVHADDFSLLEHRRISKIG